MTRIKVLVVDDSAVVREILSQGLASDPEIEVVGVAQVDTGKKKKIVDKPAIKAVEAEAAIERIGKRFQALAE